MDLAEALDNLVDWIVAHGFFLGFVSGAALVSILWVI
jgi:cysteine synthase